MLLKKIKKGLASRLQIFLGQALPRKKYLESYTERFTSLAVETTNICNADCSFCGKSSMTRKLGVMSDATYDKILHDYDDIGGGELNLTPMIGEPLVDDSIVERIRKAKAYPSINKVYFATNGILLDRRLEDGLLDSGIDRFSISLIGHDRESYKRLGGVDKWDVVIANTIRCLEENNKREKPVEIWVRIRSDLAYHKLGSISAFARLKELSSNIEFQYHYHNWGGKVSFSKGSNMKTEKASAIKGPCYVLYRGPKVLWDGELSACMCININAHPDFCLGNINDNHLMDIWLGEKRIELLRRFDRNDIPKMCKNCSHYNDFTPYLNLKHRKEAEHCFEAYRNSNYFRGKQGVKTS